MEISSWVALGSAIFAGVSALIAFLSWNQNRRIHDAQILLSKRKELITIWTYISTLNDINPNQIIVPDVIKNINTLELVALCCEGDMIDKDLIIRTFMDTYIKNFETIRSLSSFDLGGGKMRTGQDLINENDAAQEFYDEIKKIKTNLTKK